jgi:hypothetical protein
VRNLVIDFDLTVLWPLILFALVVLISSIRTFVSPSVGYWDAVEKGEDIDQWKRNQKQEVRDFLWFSAAALLILCAVMLMGDKWKLNLAYFAWKALEFVSAISFIIATGMAWHYAEKRERLKLVACLLAMLIAAASTEHFFHQATNSGHVVCPQCSSQDDEPDDR